MTLEGHIENGQIVLDGTHDLPEGFKVVVSVQSPNGGSTQDQAFSSLYERLKSVAGKAKDLPMDLAMNHDHYLHGQPKQQ